MTLHGTVTGQKAPSIPILALGALAGATGPEGFPGFLQSIFDRGLVAGLR